MNIYRSFFCFAILLCSACAKTPSIPQAELTLSSFELGPSNLYIVYFSSNIDLISAFNKYEKSNQLVPTLTCSLDKDLDFSSEHSIKVKAEGRVAANGKSEPSYSFASELVFYHTNSDGTQRDLNDYDAIKPLLLATAFIPCKVRITAYGYKAYYSNTLLIPSNIMMEQIFR